MKKNNQPEAYKERMRQHPSYWNGITVETAKEVNSKTLHTHSYCDEF